VKRHSQALIFFTLLISFANLQAQGLQCTMTSTEKDLEAMACHLQVKACEGFYQEFGEDFRREHSKSCSSSVTPSATRTAALCGGLAVTAAASIYQSMKFGDQLALARKLPAPLRKGLGNTLRFAGVAGVIYSIYSLGDLAVKGLEEDQDCFHNIDRKRETLEFLKASSDFVARKVQPLVDPNVATSLQLSPVYLEERYIQNVTCQQLKDLVLQQKNKQDRVLGPLMASGRLDKDPRKEMALSSEEQDLIQRLYQRLECLSPQTVADIVCAVGNAALGGARLKQWIAGLKVKPTVITPRLQFMINRGHLDADFIRDYPAMSGKISRAHWEISNARGSNPRVFLFSEHEVFKGVSLPDDPMLRTVLRDSYNKLNDPQELADYTSRLMREVSDEMAKRGGRLKRKLESGELDEATVKAVLLRRAQAHGETVTTVRTMRDRDFHEALSKGPIIDRATGEGHGSLTHLVQLDYVRDVIRKRAGDRTPQVFEFFGSPRGAHLWDRTFDVFKETKPGLGNSPQGFKRLLNQHVPFD